MSQPRRTFLYWIGMSFLALLFPRCSKAQNSELKKLPYHHLPDGSFRNLPGAPIRNPEPPPGKSNPFTFSRVFKRLFISSEEVAIPKGHALSEKQALAGFYAVDYDKKTNPISITWLGHAAFLIRLGKTTILTDPFLSEKSGIGFIGVKRFQSAAIRPQKLPKIDILLISHSHYDHLDGISLKKIKNKDKIQVITPLKLGKTLKRKGYKNVMEMDWYQTNLLQTSSLQTDQGKIKLTCLPASHWSRRIGQERNTTLWAGYLLEYKNQKIYFSGDTAYGKPIFQHIAQRIPTPDLAILPIGAYEPRWFMRASHASPEEAVQIGLDLKAKNLLSMHWGAIRLSTEDLWEPPKRFKKAGLKAGYKAEQIWNLAVGETRILS